MTTMNSAQSEVTQAKPSIKLLFSALLLVMLLAALDKRLRGRAWILGDDYGIVDIATFPWVRNLVGFYGAGELVPFGAGQPLDICVFAHGGLVGEDDAAKTFSKWLPKLWEASGRPLPAPVAADLGADFRGETGRDLVAAKDRDVLGQLEVLD